MTAEIVIMNRNGVAMAADSAGTLDTPDGPKVDNHTKKLFSLSTSEPVGIMIYNNLNLAGIPWEVIIKSYRKYLGDQTFSSVEKYAHHFFDFIESKRIPFELQKQDVLYKGDFSGVVFSGFGTSQYLPVTLGFKVNGMVAGEVVKSETANKRIESGSDVAICPFAQREMVDQFINGIHPSLLSLVDSTLNSVVRQLIEAVSTFTPSNPLSEIDEAKVSEIAGLYKAQIDEVITKRHGAPVLDAIRPLPIEELAAVAENLVNLTSLKQQVTNATATVGGPIDVMLISKGDGIVWTKRKHYFDPRLNYHYLRNYFGSVPGVQLQGGELENV